MQEKTSVAERAAVGGQDQATVNTSSGAAIMDCSPEPYCAIAQTSDLESIISKPLVSRFFRMLPILHAHGSVQVPSFVSGQPRQARPLDYTTYHSYHVDHNVGAHQLMPLYCPTNL